MLLDYIYLIIIFALIIVIIFLIYLSYEYRIFNQSKSNITESFTSLKIPATFNSVNPNIQNNLTNFLNKYTNTGVNAYNQQLISDNTLYNSLLNQYQTNYNNSNTILELNNKIRPLTKTFPINEVIKTIKSNYNSQYLSTITNDVNKYGILANDKCLSVSGTCANGSPFCMQDCQKGLYTTDSQKFYTNRIYSSADAAQIMGVSPDSINTKNVYPFNIFRSSVNDNCLKVDNDGIGVAPCDLNNLNQQWSISPDENICVLS
jgi:hypothetical protein